MPRCHLSLLCLCSSVLLLAAATTPAHAKSDTVPDWVHAAATAPLPKLPADTTAVVLLDDTRLLVAPNGHAVEHHRRVVRVLRPRGRDEAVIFLPFSADEKLSGLHVWSISPDQHEFALKDREIGEIGFPGQGSLYEDIRARTVTAPGTDPGGTVAVEYDQALPTYLNETHWQFQEQIPTVSTSYTVELPPGFTFSTSWAHHAALKPADLESSHWRWDLHDVPAIDLEDVALAPSGLALAGRMSIRFRGPGTPDIGDTWPSMGNWYTNLAASRLVTPPDVASRARELAGTSTDFTDRVEPIAEFVQKQIRYFVVERGIGGLQPHPVEDIFHNRFGDCKDKAALLSSMLAAVGIHADILLVDTRRGVVDPNAPSLLGNHAIAAIEIPAGYTSPRLRSISTTSTGHRYLIFDPTWDKTPFGQLEGNLQGSYGILADGATSQILHLPVLAPETNRVRRSADFRLAADGTLQGSVTEHRFGDAASERRALYLGVTEREQNQILDRILRQDLPQFVVSGYHVSNATALNQDLVTSFTLSAEHFAKPAGPLLLVRPRVLGSEEILRVLQDNRQHTHTDSRRLPFDLDSTLQQTDDFTIALPEGYTADELPEAVSLDTDFASYRSSTTLEGHSLHFTRTYTLRELTLGPDRADDLRNFATSIATDEQSTAVLKKL